MYRTEQHKGFMTVWTLTFFYKRSAYASTLCFTRINYHDMCYGSIVLNSK